MNQLKNLNLSEEDRELILLNLDFSKKISLMKKQYIISDTKFCEILQINKDQLKDFLVGNFDYNLKHLALYNIYSTRYYFKEE